MAIDTTGYASADAVQAYPPSNLGLLRSDDVQLWLADPTTISDHALVACERLLEDDELARASAFRFERHRREYLVSRALVRSALSGHDGRPPRAWRFVRNDHGRPSALDANGLAFSLANHPSLVACAIARREEIGVDVEPIARAATILDVAASVFSRTELAELSALDGPAASERAVSLWTLKEAYVKARGLGLSLALDAFTIRFGRERVTLDVHDGHDDGGRWELRTVDVVGHRIAIAVAGPLRQVRMTTLTTLVP